MQRTIRTLHVALLLAATALAMRPAAAQKKCDPLPAEVASLSPAVYTACDVDKKAVAPRDNAWMALRIEPNAALQCQRATIDVVVGEDAVPVPMTARIVKTNDSTFAAALVQQLGQLPFKAATKDGKPVRQWLRFDVNKPKGFMVSRVGTPGPMPTQRSNSC